MKMKVVRKVTAVLICCFALSCWGLQAQNTFAKGDKVVNLGIGVGRSYSAGYKSSILPISGSFEYGVKDHLFDDKSSLGVGAYLGYAQDKLSLIDNSWKVSHTIVGVRGGLHYQLVDKLDTYAGLMLGYNVVSVSSSGSGISGSGFDWSIYVGGRYYFTESIGAFAEIGYGIAAVQLGVALKF